MKRMLDQKTIDFLKSLGDSLKYESSSNTFEIGTNLYVDGDLNVDTGMIICGDSTKKGNSIDLSDTNTEIYLNGSDDDINYIEFFLDGTVQRGLTDKNVKTFFGNKSILKDPTKPEENNIDLYVHYLTIVASDSTFNGVVYSSNNIVVNSPQKLTTLLKATSAQKFISLSSDESNIQGGVLVWDGSIWQVGYNGGPLNVTSVSDIVKTI